MRTRITLKNTVFFEANQQYAGDLHADKIHADILQFTKKWNWKWIVQHQGYFCRKHPATNLSFAPKYCTFKAGLSSLSDCWEKYEAQILDVSDSNQNVETTCNSKSSLQNLKIFSSKGCRKTNKWWIIYAANTAILKLRIFRGRYCFRLWVFALAGEYFYCWHWGALLKALHGEWSHDLPKPCCSIIFEFALTNHMYMQIVSLNWGH